MVRFLLFFVCVSAWADSHLERFTLSHSGRFVAMQTADGSAVLDLTTGSRQVLGAASVEFAWAADDKSLFVTRGGSIIGYAVPGGQMRMGMTVLSGGSPPVLVDVSPNGRLVSFVRDGNLWVTSTNGKGTRALTQGQGSNLLIGMPDPVFGREFDVKQHYWWAPDSSAIAYIETEFADANHYVVAGAKLPVFRLKTVDLKNGQIRTVAETSDDWAYLLRPVWTPDSKQLLFYRMNRLQQLAELCSFEAGTIKTVLTEKDAYWINAPSTPVFVEGGKRLLVTSERTGHRHVYLYQLNGNLVSDVTPTDLEIYNLFATLDSRHAYVSGSKGNLQERHLFRLNLEGGAEQMTSEAGWHEVSLNAAGNGYLDFHSTALKAPTVEWHGSDGKSREIAGATTDEKPVSNEYFTIKTHDNVELPARLFKPDNFDPQKKYPVILYTFAGPRGRVVKDEWGDWQMAWNRAMVRKGFLVLAIDVRGSGGYSHLFEEYIHYRFGAQEVADLREVVSYLRRQTYVDGERLGIWGCDYGAHTALHAMFEFPGGFKAGFADAPITDWTKYDAYFGERYLGLPSKRFNEYNDSTPLHGARKMTGTLLAAGAAANDVLIRPDQMEALVTAVSKLKREEVKKRFKAVGQPTDLQASMSQMTDFFVQTL